MIVSMLLKLICYIKIVGALNRNFNIGNYFE